MTLERIAALRDWMGPEWDGTPENYNPPYYNTLHVQYKDLKELLDMAEQLLKAAQ
jgi:hypothetical protein